MIDESDHDEEELEEVVDDVEILNEKINRVDSLEYEEEKLLPEGDRRSEEIIPQISDNDRRAFKEEEYYDDAEKNNAYRA